MNEPMVIAASQTIRAAPEPLGEKPKTSSKYTGMNTVSPKNTPMLKKPAHETAQTVGSSKIDSGMNGSGAVATRSPNSSHSTAEPSSRLTIGAEAQGERVPPP